MGRAKSASWKKGIFQSVPLAELSATITSCSAHWWKTLKFCVSTCHFKHVSFLAARPLLIEMRLLNMHNLRALIADTDGLWYRDRGHTDHSSTSHYNFKSFNSLVKPIQHYADLWGLRHGGTTTPQTTCRGPDDGGTAADRRQITQRWAVTHDHGVLPALTQELIATPREQGRIDSGTCGTTPS